MNRVPVLEGSPYRRAIRAFLNKSLPLHADTVSNTRCPRSGAYETTSVAQWRRLELEPIHAIANPDRTFSKRTSRQNQQTAQ